MSAEPTHSRVDGFLRGIRFVLVNDRVPREDEDCALCGCKIGTGYVRESQRRAFYCGTQCFAGHAIVVAPRARRVS